MNLPISIVQRAASATGGTVNDTVDETTGAPQTINAWWLLLEFFVRSILKLTVLTHASGVFSGAYCTSVVLHVNTGAGDAPITIDATNSGAVPGFDATAATDAIAQLNAMIDAGFPVGSLKAPGSMAV